MPKNLKTKGVVNVKSQECQVTIHTEAIKLLLDGKEYEISWGCLSCGGTGITILSHEQVKIVEKSDKGYWVKLK